MLDESSMAGFIIIDSNRSISIGAGGLSELGGSKICHQGMFLDNNNRHNATRGHSYRHRFYPILTVDPVSFQVRSVSLILAQNPLHASQGAANFIYLASANSQKIYTSEIERKRNLKLVYENTIRSPVLLQTKHHRMNFIKGMPYSRIYTYQYNMPSASFRESEVKMDVNYKWHGTQCILH